MAIPYEDFLAKLPEEERAAIRAEADRLVAEEMTLRELRDVRARSQEEIAAKLGVNQASVSKMERRTDMYIGTLRSLIESMGGELEIIAKFPDRAPVKINQFKALG